MNLSILMCLYCILLIIVAYTICKTIKNNIAIVNQFLFHSYAFVFVKSCYLSNITQAKMLLY